MRVNKFIYISLLAAGALASTTSISAKVTLPAHLSDNMVVQQRSTLKVKGQSDRRGQVTVIASWNKKKVTGDIMADGTFVSWLALDGEKIIGTSGMSFVEKPPYFSCPSGRIGLLSSMFTDPDYRRMGIAKELLHRVVEEARTYGCGAVQITASDMGVKLYCFVHNGNFMQYNLKG